MLYRLLAALLLLCLIMPACANDEAATPVSGNSLTEKTAVVPPPSAAPLPPRLMAQPLDNNNDQQAVEVVSQPLRISKVKIDVTILAGVARTTQILTFANDTDRVLQGELLFPLPPGATLAGYGLDIEGQIVDAVPVEKHQARVIFEKEVRKGVDPGLAEWTQGNAFRTRIYPIPAKGTRSVKIVYLTELAQTDIANARLFSLPLNFTDKLDVFQLDIHLLQQSVSTNDKNKPRLIAGADLLGGLALRRAEGDSGERNYIATLAGEQTAVVGNIALALPTDLVPAARVELLPDPRGAAVEQDAFFLIDDQPKLPPIAPTAGTKAVGQIAIFWDASLSRQEADLTGELALLQAHLKHLNNVTVDVIVFRDRMEDPRTFEIKNGDANDLLEFLKTQPLDGATNLGALIMPAHPYGFISREMLMRARLKQRPAYDYHLLFTDGMATLGPPQLPLKIHPSRLDELLDADRMQNPSGTPIALDAEAPAQPPVFIITSATHANYPLLQNLANTSGGGGGQVIDLTTTKPEAAAQALAFPGWRLAQVVFNHDEVADVTPTAGTLQNGHITVTGRLLTSEAKVTLVYQHPSGQIVRTEHALSRPTSVIELAQKRLIDGYSDEPLIPTLWAQRRIAELSVFADEPANHDALLELGKRFGLVTPNTSLLVLETLEQHLEYGIAPAKTRPEMLAAFNKQIEEVEVAKKRSAEEKLQAVVTAWNEKVAWWEMKHEYPKDFKWTEPKGSGAVTGNAPLGLAPATPAAPPAPVTTPPSQPAPRPDVTEQAEASRQAMQSQTGHTRGNGGNLFAADALHESIAQAAQEAVAGEDEDGTVNGTTGGRVATIQLGQTPEGHEPPYLDPIRKAMSSTGDANAMYEIYLKQRAEHGRKPAFYLDVAHLFFEHANAPTDRPMMQGQRDLAQVLALRVLSNIAELDLDNPALLRVLARRLQQADELDLAILVFEQVLRLRPEEPQSYRDLALAHAARGQRLSLIGTSPSFNQPALDDYTKALTLLDTVVRREWDNRFEGVELIALVEANRLIALLPTPVHAGGFEVAIPIDPRLRKNLDSDLRIVLEWDADDTDMDLWVTEPTGEKCLYSHNRTTIGGQISRDMTQGYGPEEYLLRQSLPGQFQIQANYYGSSQQTLTGAVTLQATLITNFGRPNESRQTRTFRLTGKQDVIDVGVISLD